MSKFYKSIILTAFLLAVSVSIVHAAGLQDIEGHKNQTAIEYLYEKGVIQGYEDDTFQPDRDVNRAELLKILIKGKGITPILDEYKNCFPDVKGQWFAQKIFK